MHKRSGGDLHLHTICSDGASTPAELVAEAKAAGLRTIAVTDHDTMDGAAAAQAAARGTGLEVIAGMELSAQAGRQEIHILGLFLPLDDPTLTAELRLYQERRHGRVYAMCERLRELSVQVTAEEVLAIAGGKAPGRVHVARVLRDRGLVRTMGEAFARYLGNDAPAYVPKERPSGADAVRLIHHAGGVAVMAHPGLTQRDDRIAELVAAGLDGLEVYAPPHTPEQVVHYLRLARENELAVSAGSDFHGGGRESVAVGCVRIDDDQVDILRGRAARRRAERG